MKHDIYVLAAALLATSLVAAACGNSTDSTTTSTVTVTGTSAGTSAPPLTTTSSASAAAPTGSSDLPSLVPAPANNQRADGPDPVQENGIHKHFLVNGSPTEVMDSYKTLLEGTGWSLTVQNSGGGGGGGGATYTGTNGAAYGVFTGGGYGGTTDVDACAWPSKPSNTNCGQQN